LSELWFWVLNIDMFSMLPVKLVQLSMELIMRNLLNVEMLKSGIVGQFDCSNGIKSSNPSRKNNGFTLVELLVVIAIIGVLIALLLPAVQAARAAAARMQCSNKVRQISIAVHVYLDAYAVLPPAGTAIRGAASSPTDNNSGLNSGFIAMLPGLEQTALYNNLTSAYLQTAATNPTVTGSALNTKLAPFICPSDSEASSSGTNQSRSSYRINLGTGSYSSVANAEAGTFTTAAAVTGSPSTTGSSGEGPFKVVLYGESTSGHPGDGFSNTLFFTEKRVGKRNGSGTVLTDNSGMLFASGHPAQTGLNTHRKPGTESTDATTTAYNTTAGAPDTAPGGFFASSFHTNGVNSSFGDGAGKFINYSIDAGLWASLGTAAGGEAATPP
jgi:prepilin-type N-terminal cleavage/methylation domain-containing protein